MIIFMSNKQQTTGCKGERGELSGVITVWGEWVGDQCVKVSSHTAMLLWGWGCNTACEYGVCERVYVWDSANKLSVMLDIY